MWTRIPSNTDAPHAGGWAVAAYARGAKHARGAVIGQDIFESGVMRAPATRWPRHVGR
jgi:hypothetical protein